MSSTAALLLTAVTWAGGTHLLAQTSKNPGPVFNRCIMEQGNHKDIDTSVAFKWTKPDAQTCFADSQITGKKE